MLPKSTKNVRKREQREDLQGMSFLEREGERGVSPKDTEYAQICLRTIV